MRKKFRFIYKLLLLNILSCTFLGISIATASITNIIDAKPQITLESNSFNTKKRSKFSIDNQSEYIERGLTLIHFISEQQYEFKTFDTHSDAIAASEISALLATFIKENAHFAILAHDSASKNLLSESQKLKELGFMKLSTLKGRQAFVAHNLDGILFEETNDSSIVLTLQIPENILDEKIYFPKVKYSFEPNNDRYIAHAGGEINGIRSTNSKQALDENYKKGFRLFELDIIETSDGKIVAAHDWQMWSRFTDYTGVLPPTHSEFMKHKIYGDYSTLDMNGINTWFAAHPDATLVTDKVNRPIAFANAFVDKDRLLMELFSLLAIEEAVSNQINVLISQEPLMAIKGSKTEYLAVNNIKHVGISRRVLKKHTDLLLELKEKGIRVYVYNVNFDPGKDEAYVQENEIGLVYGMYADKWIFTNNSSTSAE